MTNTTPAPAKPAIEGSTPVTKDEALRRIRNADVAVAYRFDMDPITLVGPEVYSADSAWPLVGSPNTAIVVQFDYHAPVHGFYSTVFHTKADGYFHVDRNAGQAAGEAGPAVMDRTNVLDSVRVGHRKIPCDVCGRPLAVCASQNGHATDLGEADPIDELLAANGIATDAELGEAEILGVASYCCATGSCQADAIAFVDGLASCEEHAFHAASQAAWADGIELSRTTTWGDPAGGADLQLIVRYLVGGGYSNGRYTPATETDALDLACQVAGVLYDHID